MQDNSFWGLSCLLQDSLAVLAHVLSMAIVSPDHHDNPKLFGAVLLLLRTLHTQHVLFSTVPALNTECDQKAGLWTRKYLGSALSQTCSVRPWTNHLASLSVSSYRGCFLCPGATATLFLCLPAPVAGCVDRASSPHTPRLPPPCPCSTLTDLWKVDQLFPHIVLLISSVPVGKYIQQEITWKILAWTLRKEVSKYITIALVENTP